MGATLSGRAVSRFAWVSSAEPLSTPAAGASGTVPSAVSSTQAVQRPLGASEKIFVPHLRQTLITLIITRGLGVQLHPVLRRILSSLMRGSLQSDSATRSQYRQESQPCEQFPRAITIDSFAEIDERPAKPRS